MNPARTFAAAFWAQSYPMHWVSESFFNLISTNPNFNDNFYLFVQVYWLAPLLASLVTSTFYKCIFSAKLHIEIDQAEAIKNDVLAKV